MNEIQDQDISPLTEENLANGPTEQQLLEERKSVFIRVMMTKIQPRRKENGLHPGYEDQNPAREDAEWSSSGS